MISLISSLKFKKTKTSPKRESGSYLWMLYVKRQIYYIIKILKSGNHKINIKPSKFSKR